MSRESKILHTKNGLYNYDALENIIKHYECFGWELQQMTNSEIVLTRETQNPKYDKLCKFQAEYEDKVSEYNKLVKPEAIKFKIGLFLIGGILTLGIIAVLYLIYYIVRMVKYTKSAEDYNNRLSTLLEQMKTICDQSRELFFSQEK